MLDTNVVSNLLRDPRGRAAQRARTLQDAICVSAIVAAELRYGCAKKKSARLTSKVEQFLSEVPVVPFDLPADSEYGEIRADLERAGRPIGSNDMLIAAHARALSATLVTANEGEFSRVPGLAVENWLA